MSNVKTQRGGDLLDGFVSKQQIQDVETHFGDDGAMAEGAVGLMADEIRQIAKAAKAMLEGGLTEECIVVLMQAKLPKEKNGRPVAAKTISQFLHELSTLDTFTKPAGKR